MWRPKDWKNPYEPIGADLKKMGNQIAFEAGADALLEALIGNNQLDHIEVMGKKCKVVFIPDEE